MTDHPDLPPRDIPEDLVAYALIGGPWLARAYFCLRLLNPVCAGGRLFILARPAADAPAEVEEFPA